MIPLLSLCLLIASIAFAHAIHCRWQLDRIHAAIGAHKRMTDCLMAGQTNVAERVKALESKVQDGWTVDHAIADTLLEHMRMIDRNRSDIAAILLADSIEEAEIEAACDQVAAEYEAKKKPSCFYIDPKFGKED